MLKRFVIQRDIPGVGAMQRSQFKGASATSNEALAKLAPRVQWEHYYITMDKTFCIYLAEDEEVIQQHAQVSGFPSKTTPVSSVFGPATAGE